MTFPYLVFFNEDEVFELGPMRKMSGPHWENGAPQQGLSIPEGGERGNGEGFAGGSAARERRWGNRKTKAALEI
jgi:hypothetical protein